jgi:hypothetical protein
VRPSRDAYAATAVYDHATTPGGASGPLATASAAVGAHTASVPTASAAPLQPPPRAREQRCWFTTSISKENSVTRPLGLACECGRVDCWESLALSIAEFEALQARGERVLADAHVSSAAVEAAAPQADAVVVSA